MNPDDTFACARAKLNAVSHGTCGRMFIRANAKHARGGERTYSPCEAARWAARRRPPWGSSGLSGCLRLGAARCVLA